MHGLFRIPLMPLCKNLSFLPVLIINEIPDAHRWDAPDRTPGAQTGAVERAMVSHYAAEEVPGHHWRHYHVTAGWQAGVRLMRACSPLPPGQTPACPTQHNRRPELQPLDSFDSVNHRPLRWRDRGHLEPRVPCERAR